MQDEIGRFFRSYRDAYNRLDPDAIAAHVALPSILVARDRVLWTTRDQVRAAMENLLALYRRNNFEQADFTLVHLTPQGQNDAGVDVLWKIRRGAQPPWRFHTGYNLHRASEGWRILLCAPPTKSSAHGPAPADGEGRPAASPCSQRWRRSPPSHWRDRGLSNRKRKGVETGVRGGVVGSGRAQSWLASYGGSASLHGTGQALARTAKGRKEWRRWNLI